jgi:hypothetical protein
MTETLTQWWPLVIGGAIIWAGHYVMQTIHAANLDRREDHKELMSKLDDIAHDIGNLEGNVDGLARRYDPPDLSAYE